MTVAVHPSQTGEQFGARGLGPDDVFSRNVEVAVIIEGVADTDDEHRDEA